MNSVISTLKNYYFDVFSDGLHIEQVNCHDFKELQGVKESRRQGGYTFHYVLSGKGILNIGEKKYFLKAGDFFYLPPMVEFSYYPDESDPWKYIWFNISGNQVDAQFKKAEFTLENPVFSALDTKEIVSEFAVLFSKLKSEHSSADLYLYSSLYKILAILKDQRSTKTFKQQDIRHEHLKKIYECIDFNFTNPDFDIEVLSKIMILNHSYLCRLFKGLTGQTLKGYLVNKRIEYAADLLKNNPYSIKEIAFMCGFSDEVHFGKQFKRYKGVTAGEYRRA